MNLAYVRPTALPAAYPFRAHGYWTYSILTLVLCTFSVFLGIANVFILYYTYANDVRKFKKFKNACTFSCCPERRLYRVVAALVFVLVGSYGIISSLAFRGLFAKHAYDHACDNFSLMAEIEVRSDFGYDGGDSPTIGASSRIRYFKDGKYKYTMDLVRSYNLSLGFTKYTSDSYETVQNAGNPRWGKMALMLVLPEGNSTGGAGGVIGSDQEYFSAPGLVQDGLRGRNRTMPGPVGIVSYSLLNSTLGYPPSSAVSQLTYPSYQITFANNTAPGHPPTTKSGNIDFGRRSLDFPQLRLSQVYAGRNWRYTDNVCLPPQVRLKDPFLIQEEVRGEYAWNCRHYR